MDINGLFPIAMCDGVHDSHPAVTKCDHDGGSCCIAAVEWAWTRTHVRENARQNARQDVR